MEETSHLRDAIRATVARFDIFDFPLTSFEVWQYLPITSSYQEVRNTIDAANLESYDGFFFLPGRKLIIETRHRRYRDAEQKIQTAKRRLKLVSWLPWIKLIALANVIGAHNLKKNNDIDLFIITKKNRVWLVKSILSFILKLTGLRPTPRVVTDRLCVSFLADDTALNLDNCRLDDNDWYFSYWLAGLTPLVGSSQTYKDLMAANTWFKKTLPNWQLSMASPRRRFANTIKTNNSLGLWNYFEKLSQQLHRLVMGKALKEKLNLDTSVIATDHLLKLHTDDRRAYFFKSALERAK